MSSAAYYRRRWHTDARFKRRKGFQNTIIKLRKSIAYHRMWLEKQERRMATIMAILLDEK